MRGVLRHVKALGLAVGVLSLVGLAASVDIARACSCAPPDPFTGLQESDGAFVGRLVSRTGSGRNVVFTFDVERAVKGRIGDRVQVRSFGGCWIEAPVGQRIGLLMTRERNAWVSSLCRQVDPEELLAAAAALPAPTGRGAPALYVGGRIGAARIVALDARGRTVAYGRGKGVTRHLSVCPGGRRLAELSDESFQNVLLTIRDGRTLRVLRQRAVRLSGGRYPDGLMCEDAAGSRVVVSSLRNGWPRGSALYRLGSGPPKEIWRGDAYLSSLVPGAAYLNAGYPDGERLQKVDLRTGRVQRIATLPLRPRLVPDATGQRLAGVAYRIQRRSRLVLVQLGKATAVRWIALDAREVDGDVHFLPGGRLLFLPMEHNDTARVLDSSLRTVRRFAWAAHDTALVGSRVWGVGRTGELVSAPMPGGPGRIVRQLPGGARPEVIVAAQR